MLWVRPFMPDECSAEAEPTADPCAGRGVPAQHLLRRVAEVAAAAGHAPGVFGLSRTVGEADARGHRVLRGRPHRDGLHVVDARQRHEVAALQDERELELLAGEIRDRPAGEAAQHPLPRVAGGRGDHAVLQRPCQHAAVVAIEPGLGQAVDFVRNLDAVDAFLPGAEHVSDRQRGQIEQVGAVAARIGVAFQLDDRCTERRTHHGLQGDGGAVAGGQRIAVCDGRNGGHALAVMLEGDREGVRIVLHGRLDARGPALAQHDGATVATAAVARIEGGRVAVPDAAHGRAPRRRTRPSHQALTSR